MPDIETFLENKKTARKKNIKKAVSVSSSEPPKKTFKVEYILSALGLLLLFVLLCVSGYFYYQHQKTLKNPQMAQADEVRMIMEKIGKYVELPDETPTLATVADKEKLNKQAFFQGAQNGDKVLIFSTSQKAIIFRPVSGKIVSMTNFSPEQEKKVEPSEAEIKKEQPQEDSTVQIQTESQESLEQNSLNQEAENLDENSLAEKEKTAVSVYNGAGKNGIAALIAEKLENTPEIEVDKIETAKKVYAETVIIDFSGRNFRVVEEILKKIGGKVGEMPAGEVKPDSGILIIAGKDAL